MTETATLSLVEAGTNFDSLPETVTRRCCAGKSCKNTRLTKFSEMTEEGEYFGYARDNEEPYFTAATVEELVTKLNDSSYWPTSS